jgi:hypothetical protein
MSEQQTQLHHEIYAESLSRFRKVGEVAVLGALDSLEGERQLTEAWADFTTTVTEMLLSNSEVRDKHEITKWSKLMVRDDRLLAQDGTTDIEEMVGMGYQKSLELAAHDPRLQIQVRYDAGHRLVAQKAAAMARGECGFNTMYVPAVYPDDAVKRDGASFWKRQGYYTESKTSFIQMFHAAEDGTVITGTLSVDDSNKHIWRELFAAHDVEIPENAATEDYLQYAITLNLTEEEAKQFALNLRQQYYERANGEVRPRQSLESVLAAHEAELRQTFNQLWIPLALSVTSGRWQPALRSFVDGLLSRSQVFSPAIRQNLVYMSMSDKMTDADARLMQQMICYAQVESLRSAILGQKEAAVPHATTIATSETGYAPIVPDQQFLTMLVGAAQEGAAHGRAYLACGNAVEMGMQNTAPDAESVESNPLGVFGGKSEIKKMTCPFCGDSNQLGDPCSPNQFCTNCTATVIGGKVTSEGNGGHKHEHKQARPAPAINLASLLAKVPSAQPAAKAA